MEELLNLYLMKGVRNQAQELGYKHVHTLQAYAVRRSRHNPRNTVALLRHILLPTLRSLV